MIIKTGKFYKIVEVGYEGSIEGLTEEDLRRIFWDLTRVLAPLSSEVTYPQGAYNDYKL